MGKYYAHFTATATSSVAFDFTPVKDSEDPEGDLLDAAHSAFEGVSLCHRCSGQVDLGDFGIEDSDNDIEKVED